MATQRKTEDIPCGKCGCYVIAYRKNKQPKCTQCGAFYRRDEEIASERTAVIKKGDPVVVKLTEPYPPVVGVVVNTPKCPDGPRDMFQVQFCMPSPPNGIGEPIKWKYAFANIRPSSIICRVEPHEIIHHDSEDTLMSLLCD